MPLFDRAELISFSIVLCCWTSKSKHTQLNSIQLNIHYTLDSNSFIKVLRGLDSELRVLSWLNLVELCDSKMFLLLVVLGWRYWIKVIPVLVCLSTDTEWITCVWKPSRILSIFYGSSQCNPLVVLPLTLPITLDLSKQTQPILTPKNLCLPLHFCAEIVGNILARPFP